MLNGKYGNNSARMKKRPLTALRQELLAINGVGPETADSILLYAFDKPVFVVDAYTRRVFSRHLLLAPDAAYDTVQRYCMERLAADAAMFNEFHALIVRLAKEYCLKNNPRCKTCPLKNEKDKRLYNLLGRRLYRWVMRPSAIRLCRQAAAV